MARAAWDSLTPLLTIFSLRSGLSTERVRKQKIHFRIAAMLDGGQRRYDPSLEVLGGGLDSYLPAFKTLNRPYDAFPVVGWNRHVETIFASSFRSVPDVRLRRECLRPKDDGAVALDWVAGDDRQLGSDSPVLILLVIFCFSVMYFMLLHVWVLVLCLVVEKLCANRRTLGILPLPLQFKPILRF